MFTGLIEEIGVIYAIRRQGGAIDLTIEASHVSHDMTVGDSIAVNGVCLTATAVQPSRFSATAVEETGTRTTLGQLKTGSRVNLERALRLSDRLGGHLVAGHVDATGQALSIQARPKSWLMTIRLDQKLMRYLIEKGSITVDGVSLTIAGLTTDSFTVSIIPETWKRSTLSLTRVGQGVNIEVDLIGKYIERLTNPGQESQLSISLLEKLGY